MSKNVEYINPAGLRLDGRRPREHRRVLVELGTFPQADGSCTLTVGGTKVVARVTGPKEMGHRTDGTTEGAQISVEAAIPAFAGERRRHGKKARQSSELAQMVLESAQSLVQTSQYPSSRIHILVDVIQHDGGERAAAINAACLALANASIAMRDIPAALTVGILEQQTVCDVTGTELKSQCPLLTVAFRSHEKDAIVLCEMTSRVSELALDDMFRVAAEAAQDLSKLFFDALQVHAKTALDVANDKLAR